MDVVSMLNDVAVVTEESQALDRQSTPSGTPCDSVGFVLPIHQRISNTYSHHNNAPKYPAFESISNRRLSDSCNTQASFESSSHSTTGSKFISASINTGSSLFNNQIIDSAFSAIQEGHKIAERPAVSPSHLPSASISGHYIHYRLQESSTLSVNIPALVVEDNLHHYSRVFQSQQVSIGATMMDTRSHNSAKRTTETYRLASPQRSGSPSDAILIKRSIASSSSSPLNTTEYHVLDSSVRGQCSISQDRITEIKRQSDRTFLQEQARSVSCSAPEFQEAMQRPQRITSGRYIDKLTPTSSHATDQEKSERSSSEETDSSSANYYQPACYFQAGCDTGSPPRKAISHIFGRNKLCTRLIPEHVWVHLCRKHYQRSRYRNPTQFAHNMQCELVENQIRNVEQWSGDNCNRGEGGILKDWNLVCRKREQKRLAALPSPGIVNDGPSLAHRRRGSGKVVAPPSAPPDWLQGLCGRNYSTPDILAILERLKQDMLQGTVHIFPDVEILPNISLDEQEVELPTKYFKHSTITRSGRHLSKSFGIASNSRSRRISKVSSPSSTKGHETSNKRKTYEHRDDDNDGFRSSSSQTQFPDSMERSSRMERRQLLKSDQEALSNTHDNQAYEEAGKIIHEGHYNLVGKRCVKDLSMAQPDPGPSTAHPPFNTPRSMHHRSQSDMGAFVTYRQIFPSYQSFTSDNGCPVTSGYEEEQIPRRYDSSMSYSLTSGALLSKVPSKKLAPRKGEH